VVPPARDPGGVTLRGGEKRVTSGNWLSKKPQARLPRGFLFENSACSMLGENHGK